MPREKPDGSVIEVAEDSGGTAYSWNPPVKNWIRLPALAFLGFWLCGWAVGWVFAAGNVLGLLPGEDPDAAAKAFLAFWLALWTVGGAFAIYFFVRLVRGGSPERVVLGHNRFKYDSGDWTAALTTNPWHVMQLYQRQAAVGPFGPKRLRLDLPKSDVDVLLERVGDRQRLCFDHGAERIEIGFQLR